jgi:hypothetical protein
MKIPAKALMVQDHIWRHKLHDDDQLILLLQALDPLNKPTYWPHTPEEQLDYSDPKVPQEEARH